MEKEKFSFSVSRTILLTFIISLLISVIVSATLIFANWIASANKMTAHISLDINNDVRNQVYNFVKLPYCINETNEKIIENNMLDLSDEKQRDRFFAGVLETHNQEITGFSYGTVDGEYYGAGINKAGAIEIIKNNVTTGWKNNNYSLNKDLTADKLVSESEALFNPRSRSWYNAAVKLGGPTFSPVYKYIDMPGLAISNGWPIYNKAGKLEGVLGTHVLLSDIDKYLSDAINEYNGMSIIVEKDSNKLIANSMGLADFTVLKDSTWKRRVIDDIDNNDIKNVYNQYIINDDIKKEYKGEKDRYFINISEISMDGIDWILITAVPKSNYMTDVISSMKKSALFTLLFLLLPILIYILFIKKYLKPIKVLLSISSEFSAGDLSKRIDIIRNDEIGLISKSFNNVADKMQAFIGNLENIVKIRTNELHKINLDLEENKDELRLILDSAAEGIYGINLDYKCTFCNSSCLKILGYKDQDELLGKDMHYLIHHTYRDGNIFPIEDCRIYNALIKSEGAHVDDEVFWRADRTSFDVEYYSYPKIKNGKVIGAVITFLDISERKIKEKEIQYLSCYDVLTGLYNRSCFDKNCKNFDDESNLPLAVIFADINNLKLTNDIFGHVAGDELIKKVADILKQICRKNDIVARVGGDEFIILLPKTTVENASGILARIKAEVTAVRVKAIKCSISLGLDIKTSQHQLLDEIITNAENAMYKDKTANRQSINENIFNTLIDTLHTKNPREKQHSINVAELCSEIGRALHLSEIEISKLKRAGYLHNIGKIIIEKSILEKDLFSTEDIDKIKEHTSVGYRILSLFDDTLDLAEYVYAHHENWDGTGYPKGLHGQQIPLISRIISVVAEYDRVLNMDNGSLESRKISAIQYINNGSGTEFDPKIVEILVKIINERKMDR